MRESFFWFASIYELGYRRAKHVPTVQSCQQIYVRHYDLVEPNNVAVLKLTSDFIS